MTYDMSLEHIAYCKRIIELPAMREWIKAAKQEPEEIDELDAEF
jgi:glutathione S-transferase